MARFLTTLPVNLGYYNLGTVEAYPTGGTGPTAYGPTSYFGSDPLPERLGDSFHNAADLGTIESPFRVITLSNTHGGNTRIQSSFYKLTLPRPRSLVITQNNNPNSYQSNTNRNTIISIYKVESGNFRRELPINDSGFVCNQASIIESDSDYSTDGYEADYPSKQLDPGTYVILITNDIRYLVTTYSFSIATTLSDWRFITEAVDDVFNFGGLTEGIIESVDFGSIVTIAGSRAQYPYSSTSGLGYTRAGVSP